MDRICSQRIGNFIPNGLNPFIYAGSGGYYYIEPCFSSRWFDGIWFY